MLPEPDLFQCGSPTCGTLGRRRRELEEEERSPGERWRSAVVEERSPGDFPSMAGATVLAPEATLTLPRGLVEGQGTLGRAKPLQVYSSLLSGTSTVVGEQERAVGSGRRWYLLVIVLLYIGLITSFCLNVTLLVRREPERVLRLEEMARTGGKTRPKRFWFCFFGFYSAFVSLANKTHLVCVFFGQCPELVGFQLANFFFLSRFSKYKNKWELIWLVGNLFKVGFSW